MKELLLDTANLSIIEKYLQEWPINGITLNPSILKAEGKIPVLQRLHEIQELLHADQSLHVQVVSATYSDILEESYAIRAEFGPKIYVKIPVTGAGLSAIKELKKHNIFVTATAVQSFEQGYLATMAGADAMALYVNRMQTQDIDPYLVIKKLRKFVDDGHFHVQLLGASFHNVSQISGAYDAGADACTINPLLFSPLLDSDVMKNTVEKFRKDFESITKKGETLKTLIDKK